MTIYILTLFPEIFQSVFAKSIISRALNNKILEIKYLDLRNWGIGHHKSVDDKPYGGGKGMVMMIEPIQKALATIRPKPYTVLLSASGQLFTQTRAKSYMKKQTFAIVCGHYEGIDARVEKLVDQTISIGNYILTGGEIPAMILVDSITRLLPGSIAAGSTTEESFENELLEYPQYTRPENYKGLKVPKIILSGNHAKIAKWRADQSKQRTQKFRPDLIKKE